MSTPPAGTTQKRLLSRNDYLAPLPIPTGEKPCDVLNTIWRKNDVFVDIGNYSIGSAVMVIWPILVIFLGLAYALNDSDALIVGACITGIPILFVIQGLFREVPLPVRFNRQRREVCVPRGDDEYWIVPWESVTAAATQQSSVSQAGRATMGLLIIGFENPDPQAKDDNKHFSFGFNCGGGTTAMALWECIRSYMEIGPQAVPKAAALNAGESLRFYIDYMRDKAKTRGWILTLLWDGVFGVFIFNAPLAQYLQRKKLYPPPDLTYPAIIEWSKPLPPEQWAKRSAALETAIAKREAELAVQTAQASEDKP
ncbi:hypothetical protein [Pseudomonas extremaustralis]|uniref:Uncharacterized protein n=1 Tax=Pseudomonas extremaustralis TaxID=359110 RepID=A0A5C5QPS8_9PSED|nr:hypothetical protein [Pseudomonas extremaustralis]EZI24336.1 hypothetical protein PE143B_0128035 [Pseudomonas extremaustralis 14-3 substr. 14-3b]TWS07209.1 hypothetical protein FIV36_00180 [Pseudomonas extremaustralis]SDE72136.1 hypothetical protein SAMN05216591_0737 [Pseudomonas extremaustralis]